MRQVKREFDAMLMAGIQRLPALHHALEVTAAWLTRQIARSPRLSRLLG